MEKKTIITLGVGTIAAIGIGIAGSSMATAETQPSTSSSASAAPSAGSSAAPSADDSATSTPQSAPDAPDAPDASAGNGNTDPSKPMRSDETLLTGDVAAKVTAAAKAKEPTATIERVETDSDGVYEAHMKRTDGTEIIVQIDASYAVTGVQEMGQGGPGRHGGGRGDQSGSSDSSSSGSSSNPSDANGSNPSDANGSATPAA